MIVVLPWPLAVVVALCYGVIWFASFTIRLVIVACKGAVLILGAFWAASVTARALWLEHRRPVQ